MYLMGALQLQSCSPSFCDHASVSGMAFQNRDPVAASVTAAHKAAEPSGGAARSPLDNRLQQELMAGDVMSGDKGIFAFPESDSLIKWVGTIHRAASTVYEGLRYKLSLELPRGYLYNAPTREVPHALLPPHHPKAAPQQPSGMIYQWLIHEDIWEKIPCRNGLIGSRWAGRDHLQKSEAALTDAVYSQKTPWNWGCLQSPGESLMHQREEEAKSQKATDLKQICKHNNALSHSRN